MTDTQISITMILAVIVIFTGLGISNGRDMTKCQNLGHSEANCERWMK